MSDAGRKRLDCPFMFLPGTGRFHGFHRFPMRLTGRLES